MCKRPSFFWRLRAAQELPWSLLQGDPDERLDELAALDEAPSDSCARQIWGLLQLELSRDVIKDGIKLLGMLSW